MEKKRENIYQKSETVLKKREQKRQNWNRRSLIGSLCSFAYWFMLVLTLLAVLADVTNFLRYGQTLGLRHLLENCVQTALVLWMILALIVVLLSAIQICRIRHGYVEYVPPREPEKTRPWCQTQEKEPIPAAERYWHRITVSLGGSVILGAVYLALQWSA